MLSIHKSIFGKSCFGLSKVPSRIKYLTFGLVGLTFLGLILKPLVSAESSPVGSLNVTYSSGSDYVNQDIVGQNFMLSVATGGFATIKINAEFNPGQEKKIKVKVPTGFQIISYSATTNTPDMSDVSKVEIDGVYKDYVVSSNLTAATSDTHILDGNGNQVKFPAGTAWTNQNIVGFSKLGASTNQDVRVYGGDIEYNFVDSTTRVELVLSVGIQNELLTHVSGTEAMDPINITMSSNHGNISQDCSVTAKDVQVFQTTNNGNIVRASMRSDEVKEISDIENRSEQFGVGTITRVYNDASGSATILGDSLHLIVTYPEGVYYDDKMDVTFLGQTITGDSYNGEHNAVVVNEGSNGGGTITVDMKKIRLYNGGSTNTRYYVAAYFRADTTIYTESNAVVRGLNISYTYSRNNQTRTGSTDYTRTMGLSDDNIKVVARNLTLRDTDAEFGYAPFNYILGGFTFSSSNEYEGVKLRFEFDEGMGVRGVTVPGSNIRDIVAVTTKGRTVAIDGVPGSASSLKMVMVGERDLGLIDGEYLVSIEIVTDVSSNTYTGAYVASGCYYYGHFLDGFVGEAKLSIVDAAANDSVSTATDKTTIDWFRSGAGAYSTTVAQYNRDNIFYPNMTMEFTGTISSQYSLYGTSDLVDPIVIISLPSGLSLDFTSVKAQSLNGNKGEEWFNLVQAKPATEQIIGGIKWNTYYYKAENPYDFIVRGNAPVHADYVSRNATVKFDAIVGNVVPDYNLSLKDILSYDLGRTAVNATNSLSYVYPDTANRSGKTTDGAVYNLAAAGGNIQIKPLIGLNVGTSIRTKGFDQEFMSYNGTESSIAMIARGKPAEVKVYYESTATSGYGAGSVIYMPVPKKGLDYAKYFENLEIENPISVDTNNAIFGYSTKLASIPTLVGSDGVTWTTYFSTNVSGSNPDDYVTGDTRWEPVVASGGAVNWVKASEYAGSLSDVVMIKFVADGEIAPGSTGECIYNLELNSTVEREPNAINYWRTYNLAIAGDGSGVWNYSSIIAANADGINLAGQVFVDRNLDGKYDAPDTEYTRALYTLLLSRDDGTEPVRELSLGADGKFYNQATMRAAVGNFILREGDYTLAVVRSDGEDKYVFSGKEGDNSSNKQTYYNDIRNSEIESDVLATYHFTIDVTELSANDYTKNIGIGLSELGLTIVYEWSGDVPEEAVLPTDENEYRSGDIVSLNTSYTKDTEIVLYEDCSDNEKGCEDGKIALGTYYFSGWTTDDNIIDGDMIINNAKLIF